MYSPYSIPLPLPRVISIFGNNHWLGKITIGQLHFIIERITQTPNGSLTPVERHPGVAFQMQFLKLKAARTTLSGSYC